MCAFAIPDIKIVGTVRSEDRVEDVSIIESINDNRLWKAGWLNLLQ